MNPVRRQHTKTLVKLFESIANRYSTWQVFTDFLELGAIAFSNAVDLAQRDEREKAYLRTIGKYAPDEQKLFPQILGALTLALEDEKTDVLGQVFMELNLGNKWAGQFFTPQDIADMMALMAIDKAFAGAEIRKKGYITLSEPAVGGGAMVIGACKALLAAGINYQKHLHVTAVDVDEKAVHMAYLQLSLLHVPAVIVHGNTLSLQEWGTWYTPAHIMGGWSSRLAAARPAGPGPAMNVELELAA